MGPVQLTATAAARFHAMGARAVAQSLKKGETLDRSAFKAQTIEPLVKFEGATCSALRLERPFPDGSTYVAVVHRLAFAEQGRCWRLTLQGRTEDFDGAAAPVFEALQAMTFADQPVQPALPPQPAIGGGS